MIKHTVQSTALSTQNPIRGPGRDDTFRTAAAVSRPQIQNMPATIGRKAPCRAKSSGAAARNQEKDPSTTQRAGARRRGIMSLRFSN